MSGWIQACFKSVPTSVPQPFILGRPSFLPTEAEELPADEQEDQLGPAASKHG